MYVPIKFHKHPFHSFLIFEPQEQIMELWRHYISRRKFMFLQTCSVEADGSRTCMNGKLSLILEDTGEAKQHTRQEIESPKGLPMIRPGRVTPRSLIIRGVLWSWTYAIAISRELFHLHMLDDFLMNVKLCDLPFVQCSREQRKKQEEISVPVRQLLVLALKSFPEN